MSGSKNLLCEVDVMAVVLLDAADHGHVALLPQLRLEADLLLVMVVMTVQQQQQQGSL